MYWLKILVQRIFLNGFERESNKETYYSYPFVKNIYLTTEDDQEIGAFLISSQVIDQPTSFFVFCHGKGSDRRRATRLAKLVKYAQNNNAVFLIIDYRGFGDSTGEFELSSVNKDLDAAFRYLENEFEASKINLIAHSMGCSIAFEYCKYLKERGMKQPENLFLFAAFTSLTPILREFKIYRILERFLPFIRYLLPGDLDLDSNEKIRQFDGNLYLFHGKKDPLVLVDHSIRIKEIFEESGRSRKKAVLEISEDSHDHILSNPEHWDKIFQQSSTEHLPVDRNEMIIDREEIEVDEKEYNSNNEMSVIIDQKIN